MERERAAGASAASGVASQAPVPSPPPAAVTQPVGCSPPVGTATRTRQVIGPRPHLHKPAAQVAPPVPCDPADPGSPYTSVASLAEAARARPALTAPRHSGLSHATRAACKCRADGQNQHTHRHPAFRPLDSHAIARLACTRTYSPRFPRPIDRCHPPRKPQLAVSMSHEAPNSPPRSPVRDFHTCLVAAKIAVVGPGHG